LKHYLHAFQHHVINNYFNLQINENATKYRYNKHVGLQGTRKR